MGQLSRKRKRGSNVTDSTDTGIDTMSSPNTSTTSSNRTVNASPMARSGRPTRSATAAAAATVADETIAVNTSDVELVRTADDSLQTRTPNVSQFAATAHDMDQMDGHLLDESQSQASIPCLSQRAPPPKKKKKTQYEEPIDTQMTDVYDDNDEDMLELSNNWAEDLDASFAEPSNTQLHHRVDKHTAEAEERAKLNVAECGAIEAITLQNFMCHENFHLDLGPRINFIVGRNGSGKSAILTGIVLGLGGRASTTSRGKGVASFIKSGQTQAKIILKICNWNEWSTGKQGFDVKTYGKSILIERTINASGSSTYKIKTSDGKTVADRRDALDDIIRHFNIQVDNPICVLNQEVSRNFLNTKNARDKYQFFMKATLLEDMKNDYASSETDRSISTKILDQKGKVLPDTTRDLKELERKVRMFNELENHKEKFTHLNNEALWALVYEQKNKLEAVRAQIAKFEKRLATESAKCEAEKETIAVLEAKKTETMGRLNQLIDDVNRAKDTVEEYRAKRDEIKDKMRNKERDDRGVRTEIMATKNDMKAIEQRIKGLEQQFSNESHNRRKEEIFQLRTEIEKLRAEEQSLLERYEQLDQSVRELGESGVRIYQERNQLKSTIDGKQYDIQRLNQSRVDQLKKFGPKYPELVKRIDEAFRKKVFKKKPLGPIGNHIKLKDYSCALAVELAIKNVIYAFCCDNMQDKRELDKIIQQVFGSGGQRTPSIITRPFTALHDVSRGRVRCDEYKSLLDLMDIKESAITNCLIDQCRIEQILFIPDYKKAEELLMVTNSVPNCHQAFTQEGCVMHPQTQNSDYKSYANHKRRSASILMQSVDQMVDLLNQEVVTLNEQYRVSEQTYQSHRQELDGKRKEIQALDSRKKQCRTDTIRKDTKLKELESIGDSPPVEISTLEEEHQTYGSRMTELHEQLKVIADEKQAMNDEYMEADAQLTARKTEYDKLLDSRQPWKASLEQIKTDLSNHGLVSADCQKKMKETEALKAEEGNKAAAFETEYQTDLDRAKAETGLEVLETRRSSRAVINEIKQMEKFLNEQENSIGDKDNIFKKYTELMAHFKRVKGEVSALERHLKRMKDSLDLRRRGYVELRNFYSLMTKFFFMDVLRHKGFSGSLEIYHSQKEVNGELKKGKTLEIKVNPKAMANNESQGSQGLPSSTQMSAAGSYSDTRSLSGGERSYSTVAFILALWESAQSPFKILDEVDVFMDLMTRKISLDTMIEFASQKSGKQYIFLSPLKLQNLPNPELIKVFQMPEPKRIDS